MPTAVIRMAVPDDVGVIDSLLRQLAVTLGQEHGYTRDLRALETHGFGDDRLFHTLLAERDQIAVGMCIYFPEYSTWRGQPGVYVQDLIVAEATRGSGVGRDLLTSAMSCSAVDWGARYLRLAVDMTNQPAIDFYDSLGMVADDDNRAMLLEGDAVSNLVGAEDD